VYECYFTYQGTSDLSLRIGLNSGPTTAGVLRGEKARFQLFGDVSRYICLVRAPLMILSLQVNLCQLLSNIVSIHMRVCIDREHGI
jgi:Adenylate and Guanylate cyclase catalytic domain